MFKTAATKFAHNSTLPALGGNQDLRPLQDLITAEKSVIISLQKLSVDYSKAAEALRVWGTSEGDDLGNILGASTAMLNHFSSALSQYATHGHTIRETLKTIRTREEALDDLKRRRRTVMRKADDAEKKLAKMGPEHKHIAMQTETLNRLRDEIRIMDSDIMIEDAAIGDFKRTATRMVVGLKFGGLVECCEKGKVAGEYGKMISAEIPEDLTQPGLPRAFYTGRDKVDKFAVEGAQQLNEIQLTTVPTIGFRDRRIYDPRHAGSALPPLQGSFPGMGYQPGPLESQSSISDTKPQPLPPLQSDSSDYLPPNRSFGRNQYSSSISDVPDSPTTPLTGLGPPFPNQQYLPPQHPPPQQNHPPQQGSGFHQGPGSGFSQTFSTSRQQRSESSAVDDFGVNRPSTFDSSNITNSRGGRFATFPVKGRQDSIDRYKLPESPSISDRGELGLSLSASIAEALGGPGKSDPLGQSSHAPPSALGSRGDFDRPPTLPPILDDIAPNNPFASITQLSQPPPGAAPPDPNKKWLQEDSLHAPGGHRRQVSDNDDALLAYMTAAEIESEAAESPPQTAALTSNKLTLNTSVEDDQRTSRHVRFGQVEDMDEEIERRASNEKEKSAEGTAPIISHPQTSSPPLSPPTHGVESPLTESEQELPRIDKGKEREMLAPQHDPVKPDGLPSTPPAIDQPLDDRALDIAAAKDIARELERFSPLPPGSLRADDASAQEPNLERGRPANSQNDYITRRSPSPLIPPTAPFAKRATSPYPYPDLNSSPPASQFTPAQTYAQSYQNGNNTHNNNSSSLDFGPTKPNVSPAQAYAQSYQTSQGGPPQEVYIPNSSNLPPRFQALQQQTESTKPPRFQGSGTPTSGNTSNLSPRFQAASSGAAPVSPGPSIGPGVNLFDAPSSTAPLRLDSKLRVESPYRMGPSSFNQSNTSLHSANASGSGSPIMPPAPGTRTISAAAFKRPQPRNVSADNLGSSLGSIGGGGGDGPVKRPLPSSPYPPSRDYAPVGPPAPAALAPSSLSQLPPGQRPLSEAGEDDQYDYIDAYISNPNSPHRDEFAAQDKQGPKPPDNMNLAGWGRPRVGAYAEGKFSTNLDEDLR